MDLVEKFILRGCYQLPVDWAQSNFKSVGEWLTNRLVLGLAVGLYRGTMKQIGQFGELLTEILMFD